MTPSARPRVFVVPRDLAQVLALALLLAVPPAQAQTVIKMASLAPDGTSWHAILQDLAEKWKTLSGGRVTLRIYPGQTMGDDPIVVNKMRLGSLQAGLLGAVGALERSVYAVQLPMAYESYEEVDYVLEKLRPRLEASLEAKGFVVLNWADAGWVHFFTKVPVTTPDELKRQKMFAWAGDNDVVELYKAAGLNVVPLPSTEASTALQTGLVTAMPAPPQAAVLLQWYNHAKNMTDVKWGVLLGCTVITKTAWEKVPADLRPALMQAARDAGRRLTEESRKGAARDIENMQKRGLNVVHVDAQKAAVWRAMAEASYGRVRGGLVPADLFDEAKRLREEFRAKRPPAR